MGDLVWGNFFSQTSEDRSFSLTLIYVKAAMPRIRLAVKPTRENLFN